MRSNTCCSTHSDTLTDQQMFVKKMCCAAATGSVLHVCYGTYVAPNPIQTNAGYTATRKPHKRLICKRGIGPKCFRELGVLRIWTSRSEKCCSCVAQTIVR